MKQRIIEEVNDFCRENNITLDEGGKKLRNFLVKKIIYLEKENIKLYHYNMFMNGFKR